MVYVVDYVVQTNKLWVACVVYDIGQGTTFTFSAMTSSKSDPARMERDDAAKLPRTRWLREQQGQDKTPYMCIYNDIQFIVCIYIYMRVLMNIISARHGHSSRKKQRHPCVFDACGGRFLTNIYCRHV